MPDHNRNNLRFLQNLPSYRIGLYFFLVLNKENASRYLSHLHDGMAALCISCVVNFHSDAHSHTSGERARYFCFLLFNNISIRWKNCNIWSLSILLFTLYLHYHWCICIPFQRVPISASQWRMKTCWCWLDQMARMEWNRTNSLSKQNNLSQ